MSSCCQPRLHQCNHTTVVQKYQRQWFEVMAGLISWTQVFAAMLAECQAVVSDPVALHLMLPVKTTHWAPQDFDIFVPSDRYQCQCVKLENKRYFLVGSTTEDLVLHSFCHIQQVVTFCTNFSITLYSAHELHFRRPYILRLSGTDFAAPFDHKPWAGVLRRIQHCHGRCIAEI